MRAEGEKLVGYAKRVLVANRGEIAVRIIRTLREMGITSIAAYSDADVDAPFVKLADEAYRLGPSPAGDSYLNRDALLRVASQARVSAVHPGYGFLSENADFAERVAAAGFQFIGPSPAAMRLMGDKIAARRAAGNASVPLVPGTPGPVRSLAEAETFIETFGLPVLVKAGGGGGGRGIRIVSEREGLSDALSRASREAQTYFNNPDVYLERYFPGARHIEVQVAGDAGGKAVAIGERDCSTQRRRQKLIEETPAPNLPGHDRELMLGAAERLAEAATYVGVGTVEFLYAGEGMAYFLEMNTRIQVEHTVTEMVTGLDLIRESVRLAAGGSVPSVPVPRGHAIEVRVNAENPHNNFMPAAHRIRGYKEPGGIGIRVDSGVCEGFRIPSFYDSLIAKLIAHDEDRESAICRLLRAIAEFDVEGVPTTLPLAQAIVRTDEFREGRVTTDWLDQILDSMLDRLTPQAEPSDSGQSAPDPTELDMEVNGRRMSVRILSSPDGDIEKQRVLTSGRQRRGRDVRRAPSNPNQIVSPMHGVITSVRKEPGEAITKGEVVFVIEAMKMENEVAAAVDGKITAVHVSAGDTVDTRQPLAEIAPT
jgi:acetyl-CoA/propionyl-CoA carboxylase biotin carboxyl carrier protein